MKKLLFITGLLFSVNASAQKFTQTISQPFCDTFDNLTIQIVSNEAPDNGNLDSLDIYFKKWSSKTGIYVEGNKKIKNDTALINPLKRKIIKGAAAPLGLVPDSQVKAPNKLAAIKNSN